MRGNELIAVIFILFAVVGCRNPENDSAEETLFKIPDESATGISFVNRLDYTEEINTYTFRNFYNGGGVGLGDFNNDGLPDIFFAGNLVPSKLYLNSGNLKFTDITTSAGLSGDGVWVTGVSIADVNGDGYQDIYLCKSGPPSGNRRYNELFINNGDLTFSERSKEYGLDFTGLSVHAAFFDFDKDGDLDCYLLNNSIRSVGGYDLRVDQRNIPDSIGGNKLLRNDDNKFVDVSRSAGIYTSAIGFGLGVTIGDINKDGWQDMYVSNDFFERDYLYINNHDGTFSESLEKYMREISLGSMGADMADINNDGLPEVFVTEMLPEDDDRLKTTSQFENWDKYNLNRQKGYYHQFSRNVLQLNNGDTTFSEIARLAGVHATDWSWGALIFDMNNDGWKDIFVANGIYKDLIDQDYVNFIADQAQVRELILTQQNVLTRLIDSIPSNKLPNYAFHNNGNLTFTNHAKEWGLGMPTHSNGSAYGDLDNDGDLDIVLNNVNMPSFIIENRSRQMYPDHASLSFLLRGSGKNTSALGTKVTLKSKGKTLYQEVAPMRGFMSSVDHRILFGLGNVQIVDTVLVEWPDDKTTLLTQVKTNQLIELNQHDADEKKVETKANDSPPLFLAESGLPGVDFVHHENDFSDFDRDRLLFNMISNEGPCLCTGDVNKDGRTDFYIGGARGQAGKLYRQNAAGSFISVSDDIFEQDKNSEDTGCILFDANGDGFDDLYVTSGGSEFSSNSSALRDRLYISKRNGHVEKTAQLLPSSSRFESTSAVDAADIDDDGDLDLFVGARLVPFLYGVPANGYVLQNNGSGEFIDVTSTFAPGLVKLGLIADGKWTDVNKDGKKDLVLVGEWMPIKIFINEQGKLVDRTQEHGLENSNGWYHSLSISDFNNDGFPDLVAGNHGLNSRFKATTEQPVTLYVNDFDQNGMIEQILTRYYNDNAYPMVLRQDLVSQLPVLKKKYLHYKDYRGQTITDIFTPEQLKNAIVLHANTFETTLLLNSGKGSFEKKTLPVESQFSCTYAILTDDVDKDGNQDILLGGNLYRAKPETGIYDASYCLLLKGDGKGNFRSCSSIESGICIKGEIRSIKKLTIKNKQLLLVARNNDAPVVLKYSK